MNSTHITRKRPIFIIGTARSGTTWFGTLLASHPDIAGATAIEHKGIHESHFLSHTRYCFPKKVTCREFLERYKEEDYFKLLGLSLDGVCNRLTGNYTVNELFHCLMDEFAEQRGAQCWVEKTPKHTIYYQDLFSMFPDARFVIIRRRFRPTVLSNLNIYPKKDATRAGQVTEKVYRYASDAKAIARLKRLCGERAIELWYEDLVKDTDGELRRILDFLGLEPCDLSSEYPSNTSYSEGKKRTIEITQLGWLGMYALRGIFSLTPFVFLKAFRKRRDMRHASKFPKYRLVRAMLHV